MDSVPIKRSNQGLKALVVSTAVVCIIIALLSTWLLNFVLRWSPNTESALKIIIWLGLLFVWVIQSAISWMSWQANYYKIGSDSIEVNNKVGMLGSSHTVYRYESIISIRMTQGYLGKRFNFGDIHLSMPKIEGEVVLKDIDEPKKQLQQLQKRITERGANTHALIN